MDLTGELDPALERFLTTRSAEAEKMAGRRPASPCGAAWLMGGMNAEAARNREWGDAALLMGGLRYGQLCRVNGTVDIGLGALQRA